MNVSQSILLNEMKQTAANYLNHFTINYAGNPTNDDEKTDANQATILYLNVFSNLIYDEILGTGSVREGLLQTIDDFQSSLKTFSTSIEETKQHVDVFVADVDHYTELLAKELN